MGTALPGFNVTALNPTPVQQMPGPGGPGLSSWWDALGLGAGAWLDSESALPWLAANGTVPEGFSQLPACSAPYTVFIFYILTHVVRSTHLFASSLNTDVSPLVIGQFYTLTLLSIIMLMSSANAAIAGSRSLE